MVDKERALAGAVAEAWPSIDLVGRCRLLGASATLHGVLGTARLWRRVDFSQRSLGERSYSLKDGAVEGVLALASTSSNATSSAGRTKGADEGCGDAGADRAPPVAVRDGDGPEQIDLSGYELRGRLNTWAGTMHPVPLPYFCCLRIR